MMTKFKQKYINTSIIVVNIPHRHDIVKDSRNNLEIQAFYAKLSKVARSFRHVALVERNYFTKQGLHLYNVGREWFANLIATQINKLINNIKKNELVIALNLKEEANNKSTNVNLEFTIPECL